MGEQGIAHEQMPKAGSRFVEAITMTAWASPVSAKPRADAPAALHVAGTCTAGYWTAKQQVARDAWAAKRRVAAMRAESARAGWLAMGGLAMGGRAMGGRAMGEWVVAVVVVAVLVTGCGSGAGGQSDGTGGSGVGAGNGGEGQPEQGSGQGAAGAAGAAGFNGTDVAWIQVMVAMDEQMVGLAARVTGRLAEKMETVRKGHLQELEQLKELRKRAGMSEANPHAGHTMPGLVTPDDIAHADDERRVIERVVEHFEQRILLAQGVGSSGTQMGVKTLATAIERGSIDALASWRALSMEWVPSVHPSKEI